MEDIDIDRIQKEADEAYQRIKRGEEESVKQIWKHFDRINDKLFTFNNIMIAGFFALSKLENKHTLSIVVPILNMVFLLWIEYRMMEWHRFQSTFTTRPKKEIDKWGKYLTYTNLYGFISILSTISVGIVFLIFIIIAS